MTRGEAWCTKQQHILLLVELTTIMGGIVRSFILSIPMCLAALGQTFEVASVKANAGPLDNIETGVARHGNVTLHKTTLRECIAYAYGFTSAEEVVGPEWIADRAVRFDIVAKAPTDTPEPTLRTMLQRLLAERFSLQLHREPRPIRHYDLEVAKSGAKLPVAIEDSGRPRTVVWAGPPGLQPHDDVRTRDAARDATRDSGGGPYQSEWILRREDRVEAGQRSRRSASGPGRRTGSARIEVNRE